MNAPAANLTMLDHARIYIGFGWKVFPVWHVIHSGDQWICACEKGMECERPGKHPIADLAPNGLNDATGDVATVERWWTRYPDANIGIRTGRESNLTVVDADASNGKPGLRNLTALSGAHGGLAEMYKVETGSGGGSLHLYFKYNEALRTGTDVLGKSIDVRNDGGYVVAASSRHVSGNFYKHVAGIVPTDLPDWLRPAAAPARRGRGRGRARMEDLSDLTLEDVESALAHVDPDDRDRWLKVGVILGRTFDRSGEGWALYETWSARSPLFDVDRAGNLSRMREMFYEQSQAAPRAGQEELTVGSLIAWARENGWERPSQLRDSDHYRLAKGLVDAIAAETGERPVYAMGSLWRLENDLWCPWSMAEVAVQVGQRFGGGKYCRKGGDFASVARLAAGIAGDEMFFAETPVGFAAPSGFWRVAEDGTIECQPLTGAHRQRVRLPADPVVNGEPHRLLTMLREAFAGHDPEGQIRLLQQLTGCALTRSLWRHEIVTLLLGATSSGKSTFLNVLREAFPREAIAATSPARWGHEYYVATLAGKALNIVGELDGMEPIPGGRFKTITGRDLVDGRHPTHQPFSFVCEAAHFFNSNRTPPTTDRDDSFFRRWRILHFANVVPPERVQRDLDENIIANEFGEFLGWALQGASLVAREGGVMETEPHRQALARWRIGNNSALEFVLDREECEPGGETKGQVLFDRYKKWAAEAGVRAFGRSGFYEAIERGGALAGVRLTRREHQVFVEGVRLWEV